MTNLKERAIFLAGLGRTAIAEMRMIVERAEQLLDDPAADVIIADAELSPPTSGSHSEVEIADGAPTLIFRASVPEFASGEGLTVHFLAGQATSEADFRRMLIRKFGTDLADVAAVAQGFDGHVPFAAMFQSSQLQAKLAAIEDGTDQPGMFSFSAQWHTNYS